MHLCGENIKISQVNYHARYQRADFHNVYDYDNDKCLTVAVRLDKREYERGIKISDKVMAQIQI